MDADRRVRKQEQALLHSVLLRQAMRAWADGDVKLFLTKAHAATLVCEEIVDEAIEHWRKQA